MNYKGEITMVEIQFQLTGKIKNLQEVISAISSEKQAIDFGSITPMPDCLDIAKTNVPYELYNILCALTDGTDMIPSLESIIAKSTLLKSRLSDINIIKEAYNRVKNHTQQARKESAEIGKMLIDNYNKYGYTTAYDWCFKYWGTPENALKSGITELPETVKRTSKEPITTWGFMQATNMPAAIMEKIVQICASHKVDICGEFADEHDKRQAGVFHNNEVEMFSLPYDVRENIWNSIMGGDDDCQSAT